MKLLTIVIPMYNTEKYINRCLDSILFDEVAEDLEVLVVNDGSKDNSVEIAKKYAERFPRTVKIIDKENGGHGSTINKGLELASGKYFRVLDSDDWFDSNSFLSFMEKLKKCTEDVVVTPYYQEYVYNGVQIPFEYPGYEFDKTYDFSEIKMEKMNDLYFTMASSTYLTDVLRRSHLQLFEKTFYVDMQFNVMPILEVKTVRFLNNYIYRYFIGRPNQSMSIDSLIRNMPQHEKVLKFLIDFYKTNSEKLTDGKKEYIQRIIVLMSNSHLHILSNLWKNRKEAFRYTKGFVRYLKDTDRDIYNGVKKLPAIRYGEKIGFINVLLFNEFFNKFLNFGIKVKARLFR